MVPRLAALGVGSLISVAAKIAARADPFGVFDVSAGAVDDRLAISTRPSRDAVFGNGWRGACGDEVAGLDPGSNNPLGPVLAACLGTARAMQRCYELTPIGDSVLSLWDFSSPNSDGPELCEIDLGRVLLVGTGAVGGAICYLWPMMRFQSDAFVIVDADRIAYSNLNRVPLFFADQWNELKTDATKQYLQAWDLDCDAVPLAYSSAGQFANQFDLVIPVADEENVRWEIQSQIPPVMIHASTGPDWDAHSGRHIPFVDDCLGCRFPTGSPKTGCATGGLAAGAENPESTPQTGALPFLSLISGTMAAASIARSCSKGVTPDNHHVLYLNAAQPRFKCYERIRRAGCPKCPERFGDIWQKCHANGKLAHWTHRSICDSE
ncbi:MAG: ThiF family adenylyltransferase [Fimbriimonadaceae bacterium]